MEAIITLFGVLNKDRDNRAVCLLYDCTVSPYHGITQSCKKAFQFHVKLCDTEFNDLHANNIHHNKGCPVSVDNLNLFIFSIPFGCLLVTLTTNAVLNIFLRTGQASCLHK